MGVRRFTATSGIYQIKNICTNKFYIGSALNIEKRKNEHFNLLLRNRHFNSHLQNAWNKYGEENFKFEILEECEREKLIEKEQYYLDTLKPLYNICKIAGSSLGIKRSTETIEKLRISHLGNLNCLGRKISDQHKENIRKGKLGCVPWNKGIKIYNYHPNAILNENSVKEIRKKYIPFIYTQKMLALEYGVAVVTIRQIISKRLWSSVK